jgi:hypothetical protein
MRSRLATFELSGRLGRNSPRRDCAPSIIFSDASKPTMLASRISSSLTVLWPVPQPKSTIRGWSATDFKKAFQKVRKEAIKSSVVQCRHLVTARAVVRNLVVVNLDDEQVLDRSEVWVIIVR